MEREEVGEMEGNNNQECNVSYSPHAKLLSFPSPHPLRNLEYWYHSEKSYFHISFVQLSISYDFI